MSLNNAEFDAVRAEQDADEPLDGRDSQPADAGSSDAPQSLDQADPLRGPEAVLERNDADPLRLDGLEEFADAAPDPEAVRPASLEDQRQDPDSL